MAIEKIGNPVVERPITPDTIDDEQYIETEYDDGTLEFEFGEEAVEEAILSESVPNLEDEHFQNLAENMDEKLLNEIGGDILEAIEENKSSSAEHLETIRQGMSLLGVRVEETDDPFPGACAAHHPLILEAAVKFQARATAELFNSKGPIKTAIIGDVTEEKQEQAQRVRNHMNYQIMHQMEEYFDETEMLLFYLPIIGSCFKKTYYDALLDRPVSKFVPIDQFIVSYYASNLRTAACYTHVIERTANELLKDQISGMYMDIDLGENPPNSETGELTEEIDEIMGYSPPADDKVYTLYEHYCYLDLEEDDPLSDPDGVALPYVVTVEKDTGRVLSIRRNWMEDDDFQKPICLFTHYKFVPGMGFYGLGYIHLLGNLQMTLTATMRNLVDSGTFATLQGGFVDKRLRVRNNDGPIRPGQFKEVEAGGLDLDKAIKLLPFKEPSNVLLQMYQFVEQRGQKFADSTEQVVSDSTNYGKVGTTMALLEESTKFFSGVHKRLHQAQKHEFNILAALNYTYLDTKESFEAIGKTFEIRRADYDGRVDVLPVSDPNLSSSAQRMTLAQTLYTGALQDPEIHNRREVARYYYTTLGIDDEIIDEFVPPEEEAVPGDPISELLAVQQGKPIKAFPEQDHNAHIQVKTAFLQDPTTGGSPAMQAKIPVIQANIQEHMILKFQQETRGEMSNEQISVVQAAQQVAQKNQRMAELEAKGPDEARNKLADAEMMKVMNDGRKIELEAIDKQTKNFFESMKLELDKYRTDTQMAIAAMQQETQAQQGQLKEMMGLIKEAMKVKQAAENKPVDTKPKE